MRTVSSVFLVVLGVLSLAPSAASAAERRLRCESTEERYAYCRTQTTGIVHLRRQLSDAPCREYDTWGADRDGSGIWVREGCRAEFVVDERRWGRGDDDDDSERRGRMLRCKSEDFSYNRCEAGGRRVRDARLVRQLSDSSCTRNKSWGIDGEGLWVDKGCEGEFEIDSGRRRRRHRD